jgi:hypothetical protein
MAKRTGVRKRNKFSEPKRTKGGDNGFDLEDETQGEADVAMYYTYKTLRKSCKYSHKKALNHIGYSEAEFAPIKNRFEPTDEMTE